MQSYFLNAGARGAFCEDLTYTFNLVPVYAATDAALHNELSVEEATQHTNLWGTTYYNITRDQYKRVSDDVNKRLHNNKNEFFSKFQLILMNPTPKWRFEGLHVDVASGLPFPSLFLSMYPCINFVVP